MDIAKEVQKQIGDPFVSSFTDPLLFYVFTDQRKSDQSSVRGSKSNSLWFRTENIENP